ncbi:uncharacterized protein LOC125776841 isoform X3 [Bactrocera dorsalis]|uniref:Uncharacterized protein LOC125776841 isoform X1 n=1 Tax=Bactrocera dorsalis TaxID=27457 RepID=A0ABM3JAZ2_BACDO|nr:uncharacterized protein LOC125776841 isoform X1 [Bactrocera dorsalis]XP_049306403.1 uncharacterized protein LOC125776841 isoform X2 [Bactrocera dorsalis]XP_049306404.1 uncharacterized protein LOC125776841 isoform X3 [Bactrocera dorsalis]
MPFVNRLLLAVILSVVLQCLMVNAYYSGVVNLFTLVQPNYNLYKERIISDRKELKFYSVWTVELGPPNQEGLIPIATTEYKAYNHGYRTRNSADKAPMMETRMDEAFLREITL